jgi:fatty acid desaturase
VPGIPEKYTSKHFARGKRRYFDWFDWILPEAWDYEHNVLHHYHTSEEHDPDVAERHTECLQNLKAPYFLKYILLFFFAATWRITYYAPNTMSVLDPKTEKRIRKENILFLTVCNIFDFSKASVRQLWLRCYLSYGLIHFLIIPLLFFPLGKAAVLAVLFNKLLAEAFINLHSFIVIGPNHTADDLYRFEYHYEDREEFYINQAISSVNYNCGNDFTDYMSIWLNYQIEHHIFPDLPMLKYREIQPRIKEICKKNGIPYKQESVFIRLKKMADVCVGKTKMRCLEKFPRLEREHDYESIASNSIS